MISSEASFGSIWETARLALRGAVQAVRQPPLTIAVVLPENDAANRAGAEQRARLAEVAAQAFAMQARTLGVPARPVVTVHEAEFHDETPRLLVEGRSIRVVPAEFRDVLAAQGISPTSPQSEDDIDAMVRAACQVAIEHDPSILVGSQQRAALVARARTTGIREPADDVLGAALERIVAHGIQVSDLGKMHDALGEPIGPVHTAGELAEIAIDALGGPTITVSVRESTLRSATLTGMRRKAFTDMRTRLFADLGISFPDISVTIDDQVPDKAAAVQLNDLICAPRPLLADGVAPIAALVESRLRTHPSWFVCLREVRGTIENLRLALPDLVNTVLDRYGEPQLSLFARTFVEEQVPVRNVARLMALLLDAPPPSPGRDVVWLAEPTRHGGQSARPIGPRRLVSCTRQQINEEAARSRPGLIVAEPTHLPADLDEAIGAIPISDDDDTVQEVGRVEVDRLVALAQQQLGDDQPRLVTATQHSRTVARHVLARQYPEVAILAAEEYPLSHLTVSGHGPIRRGSTAGTS